MNLISEAAKLQDLYQKHLPESPPGSLRYTTIFCQARINALPALLDVLGEIRAGDADEIAYAIDVVAQYQNDDATTEVLRRYHAMAAKMEAEE